MILLISIMSENSVIKFVEWKVKKWKSIMLKNDLIPLLKLAVPLVLIGFVQSSVYFF